MKNKKTNAMRMLEDLGISYESRDYPTDDGLIDGVSVADKVCLPHRAVFKTLVAHDGAAIFVFIVPVEEKLSLKKAAKAAGVKKVEMLQHKDLLGKTGYVHGGCSPIGMKRLFPTFLHESAKDEERIAVSAGRVGCQVLLKPADLLRAAEASWADLIQDTGDY